MDINAITPDRIQPSAAVAAPVAAEKTSAPKQSANNKDSISLGAAVSDKAGRLDRLSDGSNSLALRAKETDQKLSILAASIDKMTSALDTIVKNFPPFSPESSARKELLMSYASIRKELLQLTYPPPPPPIYEKIQHQWQELFQQDESSNTIKLPGQPESSTPDSELKGIITDLTALHEGITAVRSDLKQTILTK